MSFSFRQTALFLFFLGSFSFVGCEKEESNDANNAGSYDCVSGDCVATKGGTYSSLSACQNVCGGAGGAETYECVNGNCVGAGENGTYGSLLSCQSSCGGVSQFEDQRDGEVYPLVEIGGRIWMAQNMRYGNVSGNVWPLSNSSFVNQYGRLYSWNAAVEACPPGWRLPVRDEVEDLNNYLLINSLTGAALKLNSWGASSSGISYNATGFSALPAGFYDFSGASSQLNGQAAFFWTASEISAFYAHMFLLTIDNQDLRIQESDMNLGFSCRCILD